MSCHEDEKREALLAHLREHLDLTCAPCKTALISEDGALAFGNAMMARFTCPKCQNEKIFVVQEDGKILEAD
jgi:hypothetical protein